MSVTAAAEVKRFDDARDVAGISASPPTKQGLTAAGVREVLCGLLRAADCLVIALAGIGAHALAYGTIPSSSDHVLAILVGTVLLMNCFHLEKLYQFGRIGNWRLQSLRISLAVFAVFIVLAAIAHFTGMRDGKLLMWGIPWAFLLFLGLAYNRLLAQSYVARARRHGGLEPSVAIIDAGGPRHDSFERIGNRVAGDAYKIVGVFGSGAPGCGLTDIDSLVKLVRLGQVDEVIVACAEVSIPPAILRRLWVLPVDIKLWGNLPPLRQSDRVLAGAPVITVLKRPISGWSWLLKRLEDVVLSGLGLVVLAPLLALVALAIRLDSPGPVIFRQQRFGFNNNEFTVYKFRTMVADHVDPLTTQARRDDPRVTRVGRFLRKTSLDELPQLFNVLVGDMSLVGPRPHAVSHNERYGELIDGYLGRHRVTPGITGWAQVNGFRGETDTLEKMRHRVEHDLYYIDQWSLLLDLRILFMTCFVGFRHHNAY